MTQPTTKPIARYMRRPCANCFSTGEHQSVRVLSADALQWRPGYQCAVCAAVQLLPLPDAEPATVSRCKWCEYPADHSVHGMDGHVFEAAS